MLQAGFMLLRGGVETRGRRLEDIQQASPKPQTTADRADSIGAVSGDCE